VGHAEAEDLEGGVKVVGLIPARGGSKRIPQKNLARLDGRHLVEWTISAAVCSVVKYQALTGIYVSTDDEQIAEVAERSGVNIVMRPPEAATDEAPMDLVVEHFAEAVEWDACVLLQPSSPLRSPAHVAAASVSLHNGRAAIGLTESAKSWEGGGTWRIGGGLVECGAIFGFQRGRPIRDWESAEPVMIPKWQAVDIDTPDDLAVARLMLERHKAEVWW
jgi:CMP-N-acetylneuraminic acid synthetase